jgi:hypothetical protein
MNQMVTFERRLILPMEFFIINSKVELDRIILDVYI